MTTPNVASILFPLKENYFDLVIFDEASQCPLEQAIPSIYRASRVVVSGDEKQLPPTSFFQARVDWDEIDAEREKELYRVGEIDNEERMELELEKLGQEFIEDVEDLLKAAKAVLPVEMLQVHYRSRYPELIEFSNRAFYKGRLHTPPSPQSIGGDGTPPIVFHHIPDGRISNRTNEKEAEKVVSLLDELLRKKGETPSVGIVTFNQAQADLIERMLDERADSDPEFAALYERARDLKDGERDMGLFVKNLETVQGDERDIMIFSTTFAPDEKGVFRRFFGPINLAGGERRLNVAVTRARVGKIVVTSMPPREIAPETETPAPGIRYSGRHYLHLYIKYARAVSERNEERVAHALKLVAEVAGSNGTTNGGNGAPESPLEEQVLRRLSGEIERKGLDDLKVCPQVGALGFRIDLAVRHIPTGAYLLGIECDGRTFHESNAARVRDLWRQEILESHGWKIHRIWSTDWWVAPGDEIEKVMRVLEPLIPQR